VIKVAKAIIYAFAMAEASVVALKVVKRQPKHISFVNRMVVDHDASMKDVTKALKVEVFVDLMVVENVAYTRVVVRAPNEAIIADFTEDRALAKLKDVHVMIVEEVSALFTVGASDAQKNAVRSHAAVMVCAHRICVYYQRTIFITVMHHTSNHFRQHGKACKIDC
jgi:hypothetical protein